MALLDPTPAPPSLRHIFVLTSPAATYAWGQQLGQRLLPPQVIALQGDLGAGKTLLTQGIAAGLGIDAPITSPTFVLVNEYDLPHGGLLFHMDSYRLGETQVQAVDAALAMGLDELLTHPDAIVVIEWAALVAPLLPADYLQITLDHHPTDPMQRQVVCTASGPVSGVLLQQLTGTAH